MLARLTLATALFACPTLALAAPDSPAPAPAPSGRYEQDGAHTSVTWRIDHFGLSRYTARFVGAKARLDWNRDDPARSTLAVEIDPRQVRTDFPVPEVEDFDAKIGSGADFLAGSPIGFLSERIVVEGENAGRVFGQLTLRGKTRPAVMEVTFNGSMAEHPIEKIAKLGFSGHMRIKRSDWGLTFALPALGDEVDIAIETEFRPEATPPAAK